MPDNKLASLNEVENQDALEAEAPERPDPARDDMAPLSAADPNPKAPVSRPNPDGPGVEGEEDAPIVTRMEPENDESAAAAADLPASDAYANTAGVLNAGSVDNKFRVPDAASQATGQSPSSSFPAPTPTRDSAVHQLMLKVAELKNHISDWNHKVDGETQKLIDGIRAL